MKRAILSLSKKPDLVLVDGIFAPKILIKCKTVIKGDEKIKCISAASILAKVYRDKIMIKMSKKLKTILGIKTLDTELNNIYWD